MASFPRLGTWADICARGAARLSPRGHVDAIRRRIGWNPGSGTTVSGPGFLPVEFGRAAGGGATGRGREARPDTTPGAILDNRSNAQGSTMTALDTFSLDGRVALIAGGGGAIGSALAEGLASAGAKVAVTGRTQDTLDEAVGGSRRPARRALRSRATRPTRPTPTAS